MSDPKNPEEAHNPEANELSEEELEAASGGLLPAQPLLTATVLKQQVVAPTEVPAAAIPPVKSSLL